MFTKKLFFGIQTLLICILKFAGFPANSADWQKGLLEYNRGNYGAALKEWNVLAAQGNASAQFNLGVMHRSGIGVPQNTKLAIKWYTLAANQGLAPAQSILGSIYRIGKDAPKDDKLARKWYALAAEQEDTDATYYLGVLYRRGALKDHVFAHMWWDIAASLGDRMAAKNRDLLAQKMSLQQIRKAHKLARQCIKNKYKNC